MFTIKDGLKYTQEEKAYFDTLSRLMEKPGSWNFNILPVSGANEIKYDTQFHFGRTLAIWAMTFDFSIINGSVVKLGKDNRLSTIPNVLQYFFGRT